ncbi:MAG TPA: ABC transporter ATP-binding protein [Hyphomicrobiaceae bacterium]|jgi:branched-chain amino acid transport system ATP-binding protein|nr:ABC transporter ATP-binding protein [Hyphomicrobiaceae bacterium]
MLEIKGLSKNFGGIIVADQIDLVLRPGRILGLIGPNGAGKTSLFNLVSGLYAPNSGTVTLDGKSLDGLALHARARLGLARTWQHVRLFPSLSVIDNLIIGARHYPAESLLTLAVRPGKIRAAAKAAHAKALDILARIGLPDCADKSVGDLPYGQQKLVGVARALMNDARCLLLDEPMAGVEGQAYEAMQKVVREVAQSDVAVCVVEHNVAFIRDLCDEAVFMFQGRILARGSIAELIANPELTELYFGH